MKTVEAKKRMKTKYGFHRILMIKKGENTIKFKYSLVYPANQADKWIEYTQTTYEMTREQANRKYAELKKQGYEITITE